MPLVEVFAREEDMPKIKVGRWTDGSHCRSRWGEEPDVLRNPDVSIVQGCETRSGWERRDLSGWMVI